MKGKNMKIEKGKTISVKYPFHVERRWIFNEIEGKNQLRCTFVPGLIKDEVYGVTVHGFGYAEFNIVKIVSPGSRYPARVFYTTQYIDPTGKRFGKNKLRVAVKYILERKIERIAKMAEIKIKVPYQTFDFAVIFDERHPWYSGE